VGLYPPVTFVAPPGAKEMAARIAQLDEQTEKSRKQRDKAREERDAEILKGLTPSDAAIYKAHIEERNRREKRWDELWRSSPCKPLSSLVPVAVP
jgi:hypothetical protein